MSALAPALLLLVRLVEAPAAGAGPVPGPVPGPEDAATDDEDVAKAEAGADAASVAADGKIAEAFVRVIGGRCGRGSVR